MRATKEHGSLRSSQTYLLGLGVGIAAVVDEPRHVSLLRGIDDLVGAQSHEVVMFVVLASVTSRATLERPVIQHLTDVLHYERAADAHQTIQH